MGWTGTHQLPCPMDTSHSLNARPHGLGAQHPEHKVDGGKGNNRIWYFLTGDGVQPGGQLHLQAVLSE